MADFRRWFLALAMLALVLGSVAPAGAQVVGASIVCGATVSVAPTLRAEGLTELTGDILLTCTAAPGAVPIAPGAIVPQADISVTVGVPLSTKTWGPYTANSPTDALLFVDDPSPANQTVCNSPQNPTIACQVIGFGAGSFNQVGGEGTPIYNVFQGVLGGPSVVSQGGDFYSITFLGVPVDPPVTTRTFRISNVRIQADRGVVLGPLSPVTAIVTASPAQSVQIPNGTNQVNVGYIAPGLKVTYTNIFPSFLQCQNYDRTLVGSISFSENFSTAFKTQTTIDPTTGLPVVQDIPGQVYYSESGYQIPVSNSYGTYTTGEATTGTELTATFYNVPAGVTLWVDNYAQSTAAVCTDSDCIGPQQQQSDAVLVGVPYGEGMTNTPTVIVDGTQTEVIPMVQATWVVENTNSSAFDTLTFNVYASLLAAPGLPIGSAMTAQGSFWPLASGWVDGDPIPEFSNSVNVQAPSGPFLQVTVCQTILLFPYITDVAGFDTGIGISNTGLDPLGTLGASAVAQTGACRVTFYTNGGVNTAYAASNPYGVPGVLSSADDNAPDASTTAAGYITPGTTWVFQLSDPAVDALYGSTPSYGFTGYAIAICDFQYAHGYTAIADYQDRNILTSYLALIIPDTTVPRAATPFICASVGCTGTLQPGEQLVH